jgi:hypothetical protein
VVVQVLGAAGSGFLEPKGTLLIKETNSKTPRFMEVMKRRLGQKRPLCMSPKGWDPFHKWPGFVACGGIKGAYISL